MRSLEEKHGFVFFCRVDGKEVLHLPQRRLSFDCKASKFSQQGDILGLEKVSEGFSRSERSADLRF